MLASIGELGLVFAQSLGLGLGVGARIDEFEAKGFEFLFEVPLLVLGTVTCCLFGFEVITELLDGRFGLTELKEKRKMLER